ncbi:MAG TPA: DUF397 domain-containing protein [Pseudonocardiaceae bacterium]|nr:DUF397 domain-containing protein [Pseudonocardiaceae bacterium]
MTAPEPDGIVGTPAATASNSDDCVEVGWRTSSYSSNSAACVEIAPAPQGVLVRDSKNRTGPALAIPDPAWRAFLTTLTP